MRLFLALPLPPEVLRRLASAAEALREGFPNLKVVRPEGLHLTLVFLGEREPAEAEQVGRLLDSPLLAVPRIPSGDGRVWAVPRREGPRGWSSPR